MKCTVNIIQDIGPNPNSNGFLDDTLQSLFVLLEQKGLSIKALIGKKITPEILEHLLTQQTDTMVKPIIYKNKTATAILKQIEKTGGLDGFGEEIRQLGREFREDFQFHNDQ
jgi:nucleoside diphosphate kinase